MAMIGVFTEALAIRDGLMQGYFWHSALEVLTWCLTGAVLSVTSALHCHCMNSETVQAAMMWIARPYWSVGRPPQRLTVRYWPSTYRDTI